MTTKIKRSPVGVTALVCACLIAACGANQSILKSGKETPPPATNASPKAPVDKELDSMRTAGFQFIYVLKRKDGGKMDADDRGVIKLQTAEANRRVATDDELTIIIGTNTQILPANMAALYKRFAIESYSQPPADNANSNADK